MSDEPFYSPNWKPTAAPRYRSKLTEPKEHISQDGPSYFDCVAEKVRTLAAVKLALVRLLEWQIDQELEGNEQQDGGPL